MKKEFSGIYSALPTPFKNKNDNVNINTDTDSVSDHDSVLDIDMIDLIGFQKLCEMQIEYVDGFVIGGTTGEAPNLSDSELELLIDAAKNTIMNKSTPTKIIVGLGTNSTRNTVERMYRFKTKCDAALIVFPYYNKPNLDGLERHLLECAKIMKIIPYYVPSRCGQTIDPNDIVRILNKIHDLTHNIVGFKDASGNLEFNLTIIENIDPYIACLTGDDFTLIPYFVWGGDGTISVLSNIIPKDIKTLFDQIKNTDKCEHEKYVDNLNNHDNLNDDKYSKKIEYLSKFLFSTSNPIPVKYLLHKMGIFDSSQLRLPLSNVDVDSDVNFNDLYNNIKHYVCNES